MPSKPYNRILDEHLHILIAQGNHEAFERLKSRYYYHALKLCRGIISQFEATDIAIGDLMAVCSYYFLSIIKKFDPSMEKSFFSFWKKITEQKVTEYLAKNFYQEKKAHKNSFSLDQDLEDKHTMYGIIYEKDDDAAIQKLVLEMKSVVRRNPDHFTKQETALLHFVLDGYSLSDLEHSGLMSRSALYLTFKSAVKKLQKLVQDSQNK